MYIFHFERTKNKKDPTHPGPKIACWIWALVLCRCSEQLTFPATVWDTGSERHDHKVLWRYHSKAPTNLDILRTEYSLLLMVGPLFKGPTPKYNLCWRRWGRPCAATMLPRSSHFMADAIVYARLKRRFCIVIHFIAVYFRVIHLLDWHECIWGKLWSGLGNCEQKRTQTNEVSNLNYKRTKRRA